MHDDTKARATRRTWNLRIDIFALMLWTILSTLTIHKIVTGEANWFNGITLVLNLWLAYTSGSRLWKAADPDAR